MRKQTLGFLAFSTLAALGVAYVPACTTEYVDEVVPAEEDSGPTPVQPKKDAGMTAKDSGVTPEKDSGVTPPKDAGSDAMVIRDASTDAAGDSGSTSSAPAPGSACATKFVVYTKKCGACGSQDAFCQDDNTVSVYGACSGEVVDGCIPGSPNRMTPCGQCGMRTEICQSNCKWAPGACTGEPANPCSPGSTKYITAGCPTANTFRKQVCDTTCQYGAISMTCEAKDTSVTISNTIGGTVSFSGEFSPATDKTPRPNAGVCPVVISATSTSYAYVEVKNTDTVPHKVEVWFDAPIGGADIDSVVLAYPGNTIPPVDRKACLTESNDICTDAPCTGSWSGLSELDSPNSAPTIPAGGSIVIGHHAWSSVSTGKFDMFVKTFN